MVVAPGTMWDVMELHDDTVSRSTAEDLDLRDDRATGAHRRWWFGVIVALDLLAIVAFVALVVLSRFT
jgi:hypothetical protein